MHVRYYHTIICRFSYTLSICDKLLNWFFNSSQRATSDTEVLYLPLREKKPVVRLVKVNNFQIFINTSLFLFQRLCLVLLFSYVSSFVEYFTCIIDKCFELRHAIHSPSLSRLGLKNILTLGSGKWLQNCLDSLTPEKFSQKFFTVTWRAYDHCTELHSPLIEQSIFKSQQALLCYVPEKKNIIFLPAESLKMKNSWENKEIEKLSTKPRVIYEIYRQLKQWLRYIAILRV